MLKATGGGVTLSGGEPLDAAGRSSPDVLRRCKELGLHTALDTSGFLGARADDELLDDIDLVLLDVKSGLPGDLPDGDGPRARADPGASAGACADRGTPIWIRFVLVPGLTDAVENVERVVADYVVASLGDGASQRVEVLPFHQMGKNKWKALRHPLPAREHHAAE